MTPFRSLQFLLLLTYVESQVFNMRMQNHEVELEESLKMVDENVTFAAQFGDHMVLQGAPSKVLVWGFAPPDMAGAEMTLLLDGEKVGITFVTDEARWSLYMGPFPPGGPHTLIALLEDGRYAALTDILFGDVWICSGQSNMEFSLSQVFNASEEISEAEKFTNIRVFAMAHNISVTPLNVLSSKNILQPWALPSKESLAGQPFTHFSAVCWLYAKYLSAKLNKPLGMIQTTWGGTPVEAWSSTRALGKCGIKENLPKSQHSVIDGMNGPTDNSVLWNGMVNPIRNTTIYGVIWYQGENNAQSGHNREKYNCTFPAMINDWRRTFHESSNSDAVFPFGFVQLAGFSPDYTIATGFPDIRWHQTADYGYAPNHQQRCVFMAVAMDLPDFLSPYGSVHPRSKQDVAARLALGGLAIAYNYTDVSYQGPRPLIVNMSTQGPDNTTLQVEYSMDIQMTWQDGFEICCAFTSPPVCVEGHAWWLPATTVKMQAKVTQTYISACSVENVVGLRYAWRESPCPVKKCPIYGLNNGLPMGPFTYHAKEFKKIPVGHRQFLVDLK